MELSVVEKIDISPNCKKVGAFLYDKDKDALYNVTPWWFPVQIGVSNGLTKCEVTPMFQLLPFIMKSWINSDILLRLIDVLQFAQRGVIMMHASCVDDTLIVGLPNAGKTYQTYKMVKDGGKLISEEYTLIQNGVASPYKNVMRTCFSARTMKDCNIKTNLWEKLWLAGATFRAWLFPFMYEAVIWKQVPASGSKSRIRKIVYGSTGREIKDWKEFAILCENEFPFMASEFLQAYALATGYDLIGIQEKQRMLIKDFVNAVYHSS